MVSTFFYLQVRGELEAALAVATAHCELPPPPPSPAQAAAGDDGRMAALASQLAATQVATAAAAGALAGIDPQPCSRVTSYPHEYCLR